MEPLQIVGQAHQAPLAGRLRQPPQRELPEPPPLFDNPDDRFHRTLAPPVQRPLPPLPCPRRYGARPAAVCSLCAIFPRPVAPSGGGGVSSAVKCACQSR